MNDESSNPRVSDEPSCSPIPDRKVASLKSIGAMGYGCRILLGLILLAGIVLVVAVLKVGDHFASTKRVETMVMTKTLADALERYFAEYGRMLLPEGPSPESADRDTDTAPTHGFVARLMGRSDEKGIDFIDGFKEAKKDPETMWGWKNGLITGDGVGPFGVVDGTGNAFRIRLDANGDHNLANPRPGQAAHGHAFLRKRVLVWSAGKDGDWSTWDDNAISW